MNTSTQVYKSCLCCRQCARIKSIRTDFLFLIFTRLAPESRQSPRNATTVSTVILVETQTQLSYLWKHKHKLWLETLWARPETPQDLSHASRLRGDSLAEDASNDMYRHQHPIQNEEENMEQDILQLHNNSN